MANAESAKDILAEYISQADHDDKYVDCVRVDDLRFIMAAIKSQQAEIAELKAEKHKPNCSSAEHNPSTGKCCGYGRSENDDEPIDACKSCELYDSYGIE